MNCPTCRKPLLLSPVLMGKPFAKFVDGKAEFELGCSICKSLFQITVKQLKGTDLEPDQLRDRKGNSPVMVTLTCGCTVEWGAECTSHKNKQVVTW
jgi:hypothetical protein